MNVVRVATIGLSRVEVNNALADTRIYNFYISPPHTASHFEPIMIVRLNS